MSSERSERKPLWLYIPQLKSQIVMNRNPLIYLAGWSEDITRELHLVLFSESDEDPLMVEDLKDAVLFVEEDFVGLPVRILREIHMARQWARTVHVVRVVVHGETYYGVIQPRLPTTVL